MSSSSEADIIASFNNAGLYLNRYLGIVIFFFGIIGNILNILVLSQKTLRSNPCAWLFLMSSIASIGAYSSGLTARILSGWNLDLSETNRGLCKLRGLVLFTSLTVTPWLIALATIDRWCSSSTIALRRQKSTLKNAQRGTIVIVCLSIGLYSQMLVCYEANLINAPLQCYSKTPQCCLLADLSFAVIIILCPILVMTLFGLMTIINLRQAHRRVHQRVISVSINHGNDTKSTNTNRSQHQRKKTDRQLLIMLCSQITLLFIFSVPLCIERFYISFTQNSSTSQLQATINTFVYNLFILFIYLANGIPFYMYTLSGGSIFRKGLLNVVQTFHRIILCQ